MAQAEKLPGTTDEEKAKKIDLCRMAVDFSRRLPATESSTPEAKRLLAQADAQIDESVRLKQQLMDEIAVWMKEASVTQAVAAEVLQVTRPRVSDVVNHKVEKFTIDALVSMLARIGKHVRLAVQ